MNEPSELPTSSALMFSFFGRHVWSHVPIEDPRARALADRHYSRQTVGASGFVPAGRRFCLLHEGSRGAAVWTVCLNLDPVGTLQWRNTIFRNESEMLSSELIRAATVTTYELWARRYGELPAQDLTTEVDIEATAARRGKRSRPGRCYEVAGWTHVRDTKPGHGRGARSIWKAPR